MTAVTGHFVQLESIAPWTVPLLAAGILALVIPFRRELSGTTLLAAWWWGCLAVIGIAATEWMVATPARAGVAGPLRYVAAALTFCPTMAVMGAKRPQDRGWQWVVFSLWLIVSLPALQACIFQRGEPFQLYLGWKIFVVMLVILEVLNHIPTRFVVAALLFVAGQLCLLALPLGFAGEHFAGEALALGMVALLAAAAAARWCVRLRPLANSSESGQNQDVEIASRTRLWRDFRDHFGAFWALRVLDRVGQTAALRRWPLRLKWHGWERLSPADPRSPDSGLPDAPANVEIASDRLWTEVDRSVATALRRFVSPDWIRERLEPGATQHD